MASGNGYNPEETLKPETEEKTVISGQETITDTVEVSEKTENMEIDKPSDTEAKLNKRDINRIFKKLIEVNETEYKDEIGKNEAQFYAQSKTNSKEFIPDISILTSETKEDEIEEIFNEFGVNDKDIVRTLEDFAVYDKYGNLIKLNDILEKPYYDFSDDLVCYGTVVTSLPEELRVKPSALPKDSNRTIVRSMLERPIPRGFRQSDFCTASPKNFRPKKKITKSKKKRATSSATNLNFNSPHYVPGVTREEAHNQAKQLLSSVSLPLKVGTIRVVQLGNITNEKGYHNQKHLYPIGFTSERMYSSVLDPEVKVRYTSEILQGEKGPLFRVTHEGGSPQYEAATSSAVWLKILKALNQRKEQMGIPPKGTAISGPEMMGFAHKKIAAVIEGLDGVLGCTQYLFRAQRIESGAPKRKRNEMVSPSPMPSPLSVETRASMEVESEKEASPLATNSNSEQETEKEDVFEENESFTNKRQKIVHLAHHEVKVFSQVQLEEVKRLSKMLSLLTTNEEKQIYQTLLKLKTVPVSLDLLYSTGLGKVVNRLRKHSSSEVGSLAKFLKKKWVNADGQEADISSEDKTKVRKACAKIVSYVGFGDESPPKGFRSHESKNAPRKKLLESLNSIDKDFEKIPVDVLVDTNIGKRVNKLRKHLDEDIQMVALKLKGKWKKQIADEEEKQKELLERVAKGDVPASSIVVEKPPSISKSALRIEQFTFDESIDIVPSTIGDLNTYQQSLVDKVRALRSQHRVRVKLTNIKGVRITHNGKQKDATLWLVTEKARYRLAGERCCSYPSYRYYYHFRDAFFSFQSAVYTIRALKEDSALSIATIPEGLSQAAKKRAKIRLMLVSASKIIKKSRKCPCPSHKLLKVNKQDQYRRLNFDVICYSYETIIDEVTRVEETDAEVEEFLKKWFLDLIISRGNCYHAKRKKENLRIEKDFFRRKGGSDEQPTIFGTLGSGTSPKAKLLAGKKMVLEGINLPDDIEILFDDCLPKESKRFGFLPRTVPEFMPLIEPTPVSEIPELSLIDKEDLLMGKIKEQKLLKMSSASLSTLLGVWTVLNLISDEIGVLDDECRKSFLSFRAKFLRGELNEVHSQLLLAILDADHTLKPKQNVSDSKYVQGEASTKITTRTSSITQDGYVKPQSENTDEVSTFAYNVDEMYPYPAFAVTEASWPAIVKRMLQLELKKEAVKGARGGLIDAYFSRKLAELIPKPDFLATCIEILNKIMDSPLVPPFANPVNTSEYPDYLSIVDRPMDLNTIKIRIESGHYDAYNLPSKQAYVEELTMPTVEIEPKPTDAVEEESDAGEEGQEDDEDIEDKDEDEGVSENGRKMQYFIKRKMRKAGKWRTKTEFQLQSELKHKKKEVAALTTDQKYYQHDCAGAGHFGVLADVRQVWRNCRKFNRSSTRIYSDSEKLESTFNKLYEKQVIKRSPELNQDLETAALIDDETTNTLKTQKLSPYSNLSFTQPLPSEVYSVLEKSEYALLAPEHKVVLLEWLVNQLLESSKIRTLFVSKMDVQQQIERDETITSKLEEKGQENDETKNEEAAQRRELYLSNLYEYSIKIDPIGEDRHFNKYFGIYPLVKQSGWIFKESSDSGEWSVMYELPQLESLMSRLDVRGCRENKLNRNLRDYWLPLWKKSVAQRKEKAATVKKELAELGSMTESSSKDDLKMLSNQLYDAEMQLQEVLPEGEMWLTATADAGKIYYYHKETRKTTWDKPEPRATMENLQEKIAKLKEEIEEKAQSPEAKRDALLESISSDGEILELIELSGTSPTQDDGTLLARNGLKRQLLSLIARLSTIEAMTLGPSCVMCYSQQHTQWCQKGRAQWYSSIDEIIAYATSELKQKQLKRTPREEMRFEESSDTVESIVEELLEEVETFGTRHQPNRYLRHKTTPPLVKQSFSVFELGNYAKLLGHLKEVVTVLYEEFEGSPYSVEELKAQEAIVRATRHKSRWQRSLNSASSIAEIALLEGQLRHLINLQQDNQYTRTLQRETKKLLQQWNWGQ